MLNTHTIPIGISFEPLHPHTLVCALSLSVLRKRSSSYNMARTKADGSIRKRQRRPPNKDLNKGAWTAQEDRKLAEAVGIHGAKEWTTIVAKAGIYYINLNKTHLLKLSLISKLILDELFLQASTVAPRVAGYDG